MESSVAKKESAVRDERLTDFVDKYETAAEATQDARYLAERDRDYFDGKQWTDDEKAELRKRRQPDTVVNRIGPKVRFLKGMEQESRTDPKAYTRTPEHEEDSDSVTDSVRYVCDNNNFETISSQVFENMIVEGFGGGVVEVKPGKKLGNFEIKVSRIHWDRIFSDPYGREPDFSDDSYRGYIRWADVADIEREFKTDIECSQDSNDSLFGETYDDKPTYKTWYDAKRKRIKLVYLWYKKKGIWHYAVYTKFQVLFDRVSPYMDDEGEPECNFIIQGTEIDRENQRRGAVRDWISTQDEVNKRRSKGVHLLNSNQVIYEKGAIEDVNKFKAQKSRPDGDMEINSGMFDKIQFLGNEADVQGHFQYMQEAKSELDSTGVNAAMSGSEGRVMSGRALLQRDQSGRTEVFYLFEAHRQWRKRMYRCIWSKVKQFWTEEHWIRVTDDENNLKWVGLNMPITMAEQMIMEETGQPVHEVKKQYGPMIQQAIAQNPQLGQVANVQHQTSDLDVDIIVEEVPDTVNIQLEQFETIARLAESRGDIPTSMLIELSTLRNKKQILEKLQGDEQQQAAAAEQQQQAAQIAQEKEISEIEVNKATAMDKQASAMERQAKVKEILLEAAQSPPLLLQ